MELQQFQFLRPYWLFVLIPLMVLIWFMVKKKLGSRSWETVCDEALLPYVLIGHTKQTRRYPVLLTALAGVLATVSLA